MDLVTDVTSFGHSNARKNRTKIGRQANSENPYHLTWTDPRRPKGRHRQSWRKVDERTDHGDLPVCCETAGDPRES